MAQPSRIGWEPFAYYFRWLDPVEPLVQNISARRPKMIHLLHFWNDEQGQDLIEYTLLMAFVALASAALFLGAGGSVKGIWSVSNNELAQANAKAS